MKKKIKIKNEEGFALLDVLIAVVVFSIGLLGAVQFIIAMQNQLIFQKLELTANLLCMNKLEEIDSKTDYTPYIGSGSWTPCSNDYNASEGDFKPFQYKVDGAQLINGKCATITVSVKFTFKKYSGVKKMTTIVMMK